MLNSCCRSSHSSKVFSTRVLSVERIYLLTRVSYVTDTIMSPSINRDISSSQGRIEELAELSISSSILSHSSSLPPLFFPCISKSASITLYFPGEWVWVWQMANALPNRLPKGSGASGPADGFDALETQIHGAWWQRYFSRFLLRYAQ